MGDPDQPGPQRPAVGLAAGAIEVAVGLQEGLLGEVLGVVLVADPVVGVGVDVAQVGPVEVLEGAVELRLGGRLEVGRLDVLRAALTAKPSGAARSGRPPGSLDPAQAGDPVVGVDLPADQRRQPAERLGRAAGGGDRLGQQRHRVEALRGLADQRRDLRPPGCPCRAARRRGGCARSGPSSSRSGRRRRPARRRSRARPRGRSRSRCTRARPRRRRSRRRSARAARRRRRPARRRSSPRPPSRPR